MRTLLIIDGIEPHVRLPLPWNYRIGCPRCGPRRFHYTPPAEVQVRAQVQWLLWPMRQEHSRICGPGLSRSLRFLLQCHRPVTTFLAYHHPQAPSANRWSKLSDVVEGRRCRREQDAEIRASKRTVGTALLKRPLSDSVRHIGYTLSQISGVGQFLIVEPEAVSFRRGRCPKCSPTADHNHLIS